MKIISQRTGFTLIELLVVISIIGLLSSVVLSSVQESRKKARNTAVKVAVGQYLKAFELMRQGGTTFASLGMTSGTAYCLGRAPITTTNQCGSATYGVIINNNFNNSISAFIAGSPNPMPRALSWIGADLGSYFSFASGESALTIVWLLEGTFHPSSTACGLGAVTLWSAGGVTYCQLNYTTSL